MARRSPLPACPRRPDRPLLLLAAGLALARSLIAQPPVLEHLFPAGGQQGTVVSVTATGALGPDSPRVWTETPGLRFESGETPGQYRVSIAANTPPGPYLVRLFTPQGATPPHFFLVSDTPEVLELGIPELRGVGEELRRLPVTVNGRLGAAGEAGTYRLPLEASQIFQATLTARGMDSPLAARLVLLDPRGRTVAASTNAAAQDPSLSVEILLGGVHRLQINPLPSLAAPPATALTSGAAVYRLHCSSAAPAPNLDAPDILGVQAPEPVGSTPSIISRSLPERTPRSHPERLWPDANLPGLQTGVINPAGDEDRFIFMARREEIHRFTLNATDPDAPFLPVLRVLDGAEQVLAESQPGPSTTLEWVAPADGPYTIVVAEAARRGSPLFRYELQLLAPEPRVTAEFDPHTFRLAPGASLAFTVRVLRPESHRGLLTILVSGLPPDVTASGNVIVPDGASATVQLTATPGAAPSNQPLQVLLFDTSVVPPRVIVARAPLRGRHTPPGALLRNETDTAWLTVLPRMP